MATQFRILKALARRSSSDVIEICKYDSHRDVLTKSSYNQLACNGSNYLLIRLITSISTEGFPWASRDRLWGWLISL